MADFFCPKCDEDFELKSKASSFSKTIVDGAYGTMMQRLREAKNPNLLLLAYSSAASAVRDYLVIPKQFFIPRIIIKRRPLAETAERAGWTGCNIDLGQIPDAGRVYIIRDGHEVPKVEVLRQWKRTLFLREENAEQKGWTLDVMKCIDGLRKDAFTLNEAYECEAVLKKLHPNNFHIKDKIRQQLQVLRDTGYLLFEGRGKYRLRRS